MARSGNRTKKKLKATRMKTTEPPQEVSSNPEEKGRWEREMAPEHPACQRKTEGGLKKRLQIRGAGRRWKNHGKACAGRGHESKWEIPAKSVCESPPPHLP
jgi:hypothetical protein